jgi:hypothetical protein
MKPIANNNSQIINNLYVRLLMIRILILILILILTLFYGNVSVYDCTIITNSFRATYDFGYGAIYRWWWWGKTKCFRNFTLTRHRRFSSTHRRSTVHPSYFHIVYTPSPCMPRMYTSYPTTPRRMPGMPTRMSSGSSTTHTAFTSSDHFTKFLIIY